MSKPIEIKPDKRFKPGNIKVDGTILRGNPETMKMTYLGDGLNPPLVVSRQLAAIIKKVQG